MSTNKFNLFSWIREGVKEAVLMGVSDAVEHIGQRDGNDASQRLLEVLRQDPEKLESRGGASEARAPRRLGRTLKDIDTAGEKKAA